MKTTTTLLRCGVVCAVFLFTNWNLFAGDDFSGLFCPEDVYVDCDDELWDLSIYGNAYYKDYGGSHDAGHPYVKYYLNSCNIGYITRTWSVRIYGDDFTCSQTIHVGGNGNFGNDHIYWPPKNVDLTGCSPDTDPYSMYDGYPTWDYNDCNLLAMSYRDTYFTISGTCNKIIREWTVLDWCVYDPYYNPYAGVYKYYQTIKISDVEIPDFECPEDIEVDAYNCVDAAVVADPLVIDPTVCGGNFTVTNNSPYADKNGNDISGTYPIGETSVKYTIKYGCGKVKTCTVTVKVKDAKAPTPYCYAYMAISLMGIDNDDDGSNDEGMAEIWAQDLDAGSYAHCVDGPLKFSFSSDISDKSRIFTCDEVGENTVQMWVTDALGNQSWCIVTLDVQNNGANIQDCVRQGDEATGEDDDATEMFTLEGTVSNIFGTNVPDVNITMTDLDGEMIVNSRMDTSYQTTYDTIYKENGAMLIRHLEETFIEEVIDTVMQYNPELEYTDQDGKYAFVQMAAPDAAYSIQASHDGESEVVIDIDDIEVLFDHLTSQKTFSTPYQYVAADVDGDGKVAFLDLRYMLMYYSGKISEFPIGVQAVYIDASLVFDQPELAIVTEHTDQIAVTGIEGDVKGLDFIKIGIGDLADTQEARVQNTLRSQKATIHAIEQVSDHDLIQQVDLLLNSDIAREPKIFPNPFSGNIHFVLTSDQVQSSHLEIYSLDGKKVKSEYLNLHQGKNELVLNLTDFNEGLYIYRLNMDGRVHSGKLIKR